MKQAGRIFAVILSVSILLGLSACSDGRLATTQENNINIKMIVKMNGGGFWEVVKMGAEAAGKEFGVNVNFDGPADENDIDGQIKLVEEAINDNPDALVLAASDYQKLVYVVEKASSAGIPVIIIDSELNSGKIRSFIGTDNVDAGKKLGETLVEKVGDKCSIAVMSFIKGTATADQREKGFFDGIQRKSGIKILSTLYCNSDENTAQALTEKLVKDNPGLNAIVCLNAYGTVGTARAIEKLGLAGKVKIIGFDSTPEEISFIEKGVIQSLVTQNPFSMGYLGVKYALDDMHGQSVPKSYNTGSTVGQHVSA
jgi:ribose transport system substrate-binding protein